MKKQKQKQMQLLQDIHLQPMPIAMNENLLPTLPQKMMFDILSRLPLGTITRFKCVCKSWRELIEGFEFATSHFSKSRSGLVLVNDVESSKPYRICAFADDDHGCPTVVADFGLPHNARPTHVCSWPFVSDNTFMKIIPHSSVNGLLLFVDGVSESRDNVFICNPITREYIKVSPPPTLHPLRRSITPFPHLSIAHHSTITYGFGASKISGEYKVVRISKAYDHRPVCEVYNVRLGLWRSCSISNGTQEHVDAGFYFNGNLHWMAYLFSNPCISCIDLETELFTVFTAPPHCDRGEYQLCALEDRLCLCMPDNFDSIVIWSMNKYGDEKSWGLLKYIINTPPPVSPSSLCESRVVPLKVFKETGDILFEEEDNERLFLYSNKAKTVQEYGLPDLCNNHYSAHFVVYTPSFFSLRTMGIQNVASF